MSEPPLDPAFGVLDGLVGPANIERLNALSGILEDGTLEDSVDQLYACKGLSDLHEAILRMTSHLSAKETYDLKNGQAEKLEGAINSKVLSTNNGTGDSALLVEAGLACLSILLSKYSFALDEDTRLKLIRVTDARDTWTTSISATTATELLAQQLKDEEMVDFIIGPVLQKTLKPLFTRHSSRITASGRPSQYSTDGDRSRMFEEVQTWKDESPWAETAMQWAVNMSTPALIQQHWPLFTPVLLALVENESIGIKSRGLEILASFVAKCPAQVLQNTGIGRVFEDATFPMLLYLPSVTPEEQSTTILSPAYDVLIKLAESSDGVQNPERRRLLDKALRDGIFAGHFHASQYSRIVQVLMQKTASIVNCLGIYSIKHLKNLLSMISTIMTDPFATAHPPTVITATQALNTIIANCWPRIQETEHAEQIIRILSLCWLNVAEESQSNSTQIPEADVEILSQELVRTSKILQAIWAEDDSKRPRRLDEVLEKEPRLAKLFAPALA
ncbi:hypothetical protein CEP52_004916 [Fusarium oligoseptatum]|uniref:Uncharacterized protein n=1 Tax=Fusarium oligoseptatum TaxID=2604345 RepID=A0A428U120_9HYPO|nr:hypothetical protein CEP52_004916 [Fusarium oligoseptatum]